MNKPSQFVPAGAVIVLAGIAQSETGESLGAGIQVQTQGSCEAFPETREGLQQMQCLLLEAIAHIGRAMLSAPTRGESGSKVVKVSAMPPMPQGFKM